MDERVRALVQSACALPEENLSEQSRISELSLDSLSFVTLVVGLEELYNVEFEPEELLPETYETLGALLAAAEGKCRP